MSSTFYAELKFRSEDLEGKEFDLASRRGNRRAKIIFLIDAQIPSDTIGRLQNMIGSIQVMLQTNPSLVESIELIPYLSLKRVAALTGNRDTIRGVIGQVLKQFNLSESSLGDIMAADWDGRGVHDVRLSVTRMSDPNAITVGNQVPDFEQGASWVIVADQYNRIYSTMFNVPVSDEPDEFAGFVNDVIASLPSAEAQNELVSAFNALYAQKSGG